jgi:IclR family transcriptional regulator, acetate operon repressor
MTVQSVVRAFDILEILYKAENQQDGIGVMAVSKLLGLKLPTVHNLVKTLVELGYAEQLDDGKYRPGPKADRFGMKSDSTLLNIAKPHIDTLMKNVNETTVLIIRHNGLRYTLLQKECKRELKVSADSAPNDNFCGTATGLAILSSLNSKQLNTYLADSPLSFTGHFKDKEALNVTLDQIKKDGYCSLKKDEFYVFGVPLTKPSAELHAALGVFVPLTRYNSKIEKKITNEMQKAVQAILLCMQ